MKSRNGGFSGAGISSLMIVFTVLALAIFTLLDLLTVRQDLSMSRKYSAAQEEYYAADTLAVQKLSQLNTLISENSDPKLLKFAAENAGFTVSDDGQTISWRSDINDAQYIECEAVITDGEAQVTEWRTMHTDAYAHEDSLPIWDGSTLPT